MTVLTAPALQYFQDEVNQVDSTKILTIHDIPAPGYSYYEWSYDGLTVKAGSKLAAEHGLSALLHDMGFAWYAPFDTTHSIIPPKRPSTINVGLSQAKTTYAITDSAFGPSYNVAGWGADFLPDRFQLLDNYDKWAVLNCVHNSRFDFVSGHRWQAVLLSDPVFWESNQDMLLESPPDTPLGNRRFDLVGLKTNPTKRANCVMACAAYLLDVGLNEQHRTHFDPADGDPHNTDDVFDFARDVCIQIRAGTEAIGKYPAFPTGVPDAVLNILAYSRHGTPPTGENPNDSDFLHIQITTAYQISELSIPQLIEGWKPKAESLSMYLYWDLPIWFNCMPISDRTTKAEYFNNELSNHIATGNITRFGAEMSCNWFNCIVKYHQYITYGRTGAFTYAQALSAVISDVFGNDPAVVKLYNLWGDDTSFLHPWSLAESFGYVSEMEESWYKTAFMELHVIYDEYRELHNLPVEHPNLPWISSGSGIRTPILDTNHPDYNDLTENGLTDPLPQALKRLMGHAHAVRMDQHFHVWAMQSRMANGGTMLDHYPELYLSRRILPAGNPPFETDPEWMYAPFAVRPTVNEFEFRKAKLDSLTARPQADLMDSEELVLVTGIEPNFSASASSDIHLQKDVNNSWARIKFVALPGGGTVTVTRTVLKSTMTENGIPLEANDPNPNFAITNDYPEGLHDISAGKNVRVSCTNGYLFFAGFPPVATEKDQGQFYWLFIPESAAGQTYVSSNGNFAARNANGNFMPIGKDSGNGPWDWGFGHITIKRQSTRGQHILHKGINKWFSLDGTVALMPNAMAEAEDFGPSVTITNLTDEAPDDEECTDHWLRCWLSRMVSYFRQFISRITFWN